MIVVGRLQPAGRLPDPLAPLGNGHRPAVDDVLLQVAARDQFHHEIQEGGRPGIRRRQPAAVECHDDVRMLQARQDAHLGREPFQQQRRALVVHRQDLDRHAPFHEQVLGDEHDAHGPGPDAIQNPMVSKDQAVGRAGHDPLELVIGEQAGFDHRLAEALGGTVRLQSFDIIAEEAERLLGRQKLIADETVDKRPAAGRQFPAIAQVGIAARVRSGGAQECGRFTGGRPKVGQPAFALRTPRHCRRLQNASGWIRMLQPLESEFLVGPPLAESAAARPKHTSETPPLQKRKPGGSQKFAGTKCTTGHARGFPVSYSG